MSDPGEDPAAAPGGAQMAFDFPARPALGRADFLVAPCNAAAVAWIDRWPDWPGPALALVGPEGCGKTHLAHVLAARAGARVLDRPDAEALNAALIAGERGPLVVELAPGTPRLDPAAEEALVHVLNLAREHGDHCLLTSTAPPARWRVALPDLHSRLAALPVAEITPPDETLLEMVLVKLFADRQVIVPPDVMRFLARRIDRSFAAARDIVARLDALAWGRGRAITLPLARELLGRPDVSRRRDPPAG
ncbi:HdaA/DnaA family protein [Roseospira goensis]|uniref:Chromosomal replication initiation ATPase DnaA n=1 Tax=Roseospira goensis TaxID=391922 RepID=A0A7W6S1U7_9PROT|nr:DnaA/Hda family protein [Roseospira goensis]MBB4286632.1 chromosomal replication initiation ATPase DnaA [Roseospira goensis]